MLQSIIVYEAMTHASPTVAQGHAAALGAQPGTTCHHSHTYMSTGASHTFHTSSLISQKFKGMLLQRVPSQARSVCSDMDAASMWGGAGKDGGAASVDGAATVAGGSRASVCVCVRARARRRGCGQRVSGAGEDGGRGGNTGG